MRCFSITFVKYRLSNLVTVAALLGCLKVEIQGYVVDLMVARVKDPPQPCLKIKAKEA